jgi:hypothetical protein
MGERLDRANVWLDRVMPVVAGIALPVGMFTWACTLPEHRAVRWGHVCLCRRRVHLDTSTAQAGAGVFRVEESLNHATARLDTRRFRVCDRCGANCRTCDLRPANDPLGNAEERHVIQLSKNKYFDATLGTGLVAAVAVMVLGLLWINAWIERRKAARFTPQKDLQETIRELSQKHASGPQP